MQANETLVIYCSRCGKSSSKTDVRWVEGLCEDCVAKVDRRRLVSMVMVENDYVLMSFHKPIDASPCIPSGYISRPLTEIKQLVLGGWYDFNTLFGEEEKK